MKIRLGLPYSAAGALCRAAQAAGAETLISAGAMWRQGRGFTPIGLAAWLTPSALDSAGFSAMRQGGYRWTVAQYVEFVVTNSGDGAMVFPWAWWAAMDYCCEAEIAPTLQGRLPADYLRSATELTAVCRDGRLPGLVGVGSVCRRNLRGPDGLLAVLAALDGLPTYVRLHLFGVKGSLLEHLGPYADRVESVDSMAWDSRARHEARDLGLPFASDLRAEHLQRWYAAQLAAVAAVPPPVAQLRLFGRAA